MEVDGPGGDDAASSTPVITTDKSGRLDSGLLLLLSRVRSMQRLSILRRNGEKSDQVWASAWVLGAVAADLAAGVELVPCLL